MAKKKDYSALIAACDTGESMIKQRTKHMKLQGFSGAGKTNFYLTMFNDMAKDKKPEEALLCIIDCDLEGQADLIARSQSSTQNYASAFSEKSAPLQMKSTT